MEMLLLGITVISLVVALVMSVTAWRLARDEKRRSAARVAALSIAAAAPHEAANSGSQGLSPDAIGFQAQPAVVEKPRPRAPWAPAPVAAEAPRRSAFVTPPPVPELPLHTAPSRNLSHASGFLGADTEPARQASGGQRSLAVAAVVLLVVLAGSLAWTMSAPRGTSAAAVGPNSPLELVSLRHDRKNEKIAVSGLVRNPAAGKPVERLAAVVFLFDRQGTLVTSAKAEVDFLKLGSGDESPFVVSLDAPATVARYRVSFRTDEGVVPHLDRRGAAPIATEGQQPVSVTLK